MLENSNHRGRMLSKINHFQPPATLQVSGVLGVFCWGLARVVFRSGYKQFSKKGF